MSDQKTMIFELAEAFSKALDGEFTILPADFYVAILHPQLGLAAVTPGDQVEEAQRAAGDLTLKAATANVAFPAMHFGLSFKQAVSPWLIKYGPNFEKDIVQEMTRRSKGRPLLGVDNVSKILSEFGTDDIVRESLPPANRQLPSELHLVTRKCIERALDGAVPVVCGVEMDIDDLAAANFMLPALLISSALTWTIPVVAQKGKGGFLVHLERDADALLGYRVIGLDTSSPILLFLPMIDLIRRATRNGECDLDIVLHRFADFLIINGMDASALEDVDIRVVSTS